MRSAGIRGSKLGIRQREAPWSAAGELPPSGMVAKPQLETSAIKPMEIPLLNGAKRELRSRTPRLAFGEQGRAAAA
jgi:hypothetical protein